MMTKQISAMLGTGLLLAALGASPARADDPAKKEPAAKPEAKKPEAKKPEAKKPEPKADAKPAAKPPEAKKPKADPAAKVEPAVPPVAAPASPTAPAKKAAGGASAELKAGTSVEKHALVGEATTFPADTTVWVWSQVNDVDEKVVHVWKHDGKEVWRRDLAVGSHHWSTYSIHKCKAGTWEVEAQTADGASLGTTTFTVQ
jgi:hypothetical protein